MAMESVLSYDGIRLEGHSIKSDGKFKFAAAGIGWKETATSNVTTLKAEDFKRIIWLKSARNYQIRIYSKGGNVSKFDGFQKESYEEIRDFIRGNYTVLLEMKEFSYKGQNWGNIDLQSGHLEFQTEDSKKVLFEIPLNEISNATVSAKNEVTVEMNQYEEIRKNDNLFEIRFFIPDNAFGDEDSNNNNLNSCESFCESIKANSNLNNIKDEVVASFPDMGCLVPRGRYEVDATEEFLRFHGKTYDFRILYSNTTSMFLLPKPDDVHVLLVIGVDPPVRQGQTRYPFVIVQFPTDLEMEMELNLSENILKDKFEGKLQKKYDAPAFQVVSSIVKGLSGRKIIAPGTFKNYQNVNSIRVAYKANEGYLYPLEKSMLMIPKPVLLISYIEISVISFGRVGTGIGKSRTFDMKVILRNGNEHQFSNIVKEEFDILKSFLESKGIRTKSAVEETVNAHELFEDDEDDASVDRGSAGEDNSSEDEEYRLSNEEDSDESGSSSDNDSDEGNVTNGADNSEEHDENEDSQNKRSKS